MSYFLWYHKIGKTDEKPGQIMSRECNPFLQNLVVSFLHHLVPIFPQPTGHASILFHPSDVVPVFHSILSLLSLLFFPQNSSFFSKAGRFPFQLALGLLALPTLETVKTTLCKGDLGSAARTTAIVETVKVVWRWSRKRSRIATIRTG